MNFDIGEELLEAVVLFSFLIVSKAEEAEVMGHDQIPLFEFVQHLQLLDPRLLGLIDALVVTIS